MGRRGERREREGMMMRGSEVRGGEGRGGGDGKGMMVWDGMSCRIFSQKYKEEYVQNRMHVML